MSPEWQPKSADLSLSGMVALLDLVERPAAAIGQSGTILGVNQKFHDYTIRHGLIPHDQIGALLDPETQQRVMSLLGGPATSRHEVQLGFRDGTLCKGQVEVLQAAAGTLVLFLVLEGAGPAEPSLRATASLRHDIAGPLTAILGTAELLLIRGGDNLPREVRDSLGQILENCGRITEILHHSRAAERGGDGYES